MSPDLAAAIGDALGAGLTRLTPVGSGFTANWRGEVGGERVFVKLCPDPDRLAAEADGLGALAACREILVPAVLACGEAAGQGYLVLEWLELSPAGDATRMGEGVAALHHLTADAYGWHRDNYLGASPQENVPLADWADFFARRRLEPQLARARAAFPAIIAPGDRLLAALPRLLSGHRPGAALLHGDLWQGNAGYVGGWPCLFDPAVHYGDPECDLAMAELFGGFPPPFFAAYTAASPLPPGWRERRRLYQLYHLLNHLNLFGSGYVRPVLAALHELG